VDAYDHYSPLRFCSADVAMMTRCLRETRAFGVPPDKISQLSTDTRTPPTRESILGLVRQVLSTRQDDEGIFFYFAGHGKAHRGKPYLVTQDTRPSDFADSAIAVEDLLASLRDATVPTRVFVLDSCHSGIHRDAGRQRGTGVDAFERTLTQLFLQDEGSVVFSSATLDEVARETILNGEGHGVFTHAFAESHPEQRRSADSGQLACVETLYTRARGLTLELSRSTQHPRLLYAAGDPIPLFPDIPDTAELVQRASGDFMSMTIEN
ncbi:MAG: caspase family protein, partial [Coriobacteriia bacterium]|nr:caspase family protein [Coriobacteriia bacterium]